MEEEQWERRYEGPLSMSVATRVRKYNNACSAAGLLFLCENSQDVQRNQGLSDNERL